MIENRALRRYFMAPCCNNVVTPKMIKAGRVSVGDRIQLDEDYIKGGSETAPAAIPAAAPAAASAAGAAGASENTKREYQPLPYSQMTPYMNNVAVQNSMDPPTIITPQDPMTPSGFDSSIDLDAVQSLNGFLRTQIGRYMRIEQLIGSNTIQDRFGFLIGVGSNFIILQEITTGNIMVLDIFSVRLAYVYYSQPVLPNF